MRYRALALPVLVVGLVTIAVGQPPGPRDTPKEGFEKTKDAGPSFFDFVPPRSIPAGAADFSIKLEVEFALENGPVVYRVGLTNRAKEERECVRHTHDGAVRISNEPGWVRRAEQPFTCMLICGQYGPYRERVRAGETATELVAVQHLYRSIPPGRATVEYSWYVPGGPKPGWQNARRSEWEGVTLDTEGDGVSGSEPVRGRSSIAVQKATPENVARVKERLERFLTEAETKTWPTGKVLACLVGSRHPEFLPLMLRAITSFDGCDSRPLLDTVYDSFADPTTGFEPLLAFLRRGESSVRWVFEYWRHQEHEYRSYLQDLRTLSESREGKRTEARVEHPVYGPNWRERVRVQAWNYGRVHPNSRLTPDQHVRIQGLENVWVRAAYWLEFPEWCFPFWVARLYADLRRAVDPPAVAAIASIGKDLASDRFAVREKATAEAMGMHEGIVPALRTYLRDNPSAELEERVRVIAGHFEQQPIPPLAERVIESAMYSGQFQGVLIFRALTGPTAQGRLADFARQRLPEQQERYCEGEAARLGWERSQTGR
jgi:hypothetical protein